MKEEIYTIPVMDGFDSDTECPFCSMYRKLENDNIGFVLSPSYMEEDVRGDTNEKGFCKLHLLQLYERGNALGLALMMHSHLKHRITQLELLEKEQAAGPRKGLFKKETAESPVSKFRSRLADSCYICDRISNSFSHYLSTFFMLWRKDQTFRAKVASSKGYCLDHYLMLLESTDQYLKGKDAEEFRADLMAREKENLNRVADELEWFTLKFDYRYKDKPWKNSQDALPRTILKVNSQFVEK
ncbi:MAG: hypothetical protein IJM90_06120 [Firmicutes bacterium]|nr:hypothetical protein [Bacillota bacterium]